jgi:hypothetical protein
MAQNVWKNMGVAVQGVNFELFSYKFKIQNPKPFILQTFLTTDPHTYTYRRLVSCTNSILQQK